MCHLIRQVIFLPPFDQMVEFIYGGEVMRLFIQSFIKVLVQAGSFSVIELATGFTKKTFKSVMNIDLVADCLHSLPGFLVVMLCPRKRKKNSAHGSIPYIMVMSSINL